MTMWKEMCRMKRGIKGDAKEGRWEGRKGRKRLVDFSKFKQI